MIVKNLTKKTILTTNLTEARSIKQKLLGLLDKKNPRSLLFRTRFGIHTFFLDKEIDVILLNQKNRVVSVKTIKRNRVFLYNPKYLTVLELPAKTIKKTKTEKNDLLKLTAI